MVFPARLQADDEQSRRSSAFIWRDFMITVAAIFERPNAEQTRCWVCVFVGPKIRISRLDSPRAILRREPPGMAGTMGTWSRGGLGLAGGFSLGAVASLMLRGVGPVLALGALRGPADRIGGRRMWTGGFGRRDCWRRQGNRAVGAGTGVGGGLITSIFIRGQKGQDPGGKRYDISPGADTRATA